MLLDVTNLSIALRTDIGVHPVVRDVSFSIAPGETLALVGESGCGKSLTALSLLQLLPPVAQISAGTLAWNGRRGLCDLRHIAPHEWPAVRGADIAMIFQEPMSALNPVMTIGDQIAESILMHAQCPVSALTGRIIELLQLVGLSDPVLRMQNYPHELSGGMRQRVMIAMALAHHPQLLIADEPTTALDVTIQAQILDLLRSLQQQFGMGLLLITHDLGVVAQCAQRVAVMYAGEMVEQGPVHDVLSNPRHPYTAGLVAALPQIGAQRERMATIPGRVPDVGQLPMGCAFAPRCPVRRDQCQTIVPWTDDAPRGVRCHFPLTPGADRGPHGTA